MRLQLANTGVLGEVAQLEAAGEYAKACELLSPYWAGPGHQPNGSGLSSSQQAFLLLRAGSLTGWMGSQRQTEQSQEQAKDLLTQSLDLFLKIGDEHGVAEAEKCLALCYWRQASFDEARLINHRAAARLQKHDDLWFIIKVNLAFTEWSDKKTPESLSILAGLADEIQNAGHSVQAAFYNCRALCLKAIGKTDEALTDYITASHHFERAGHQRFRARVEHNIGNLYLKLGRFNEAHQHLDYSEAILDTLEDQGALAQLWETRACVLLAEKRFDAAEKFARQSVETISTGQEYGLLTDSLITHALALNAVSRRTEAIITFDRAYQIAITHISIERAGEIAVTMLQVVSGEACMVAHVSLEDAVRAFERSYISAAMMATDGKVTAAALRLGISQQSLTWILTNKYPDLRIRDKRKAPQFKKLVSSKRHG